MLLFVLLWSILSVVFASSITTIAGTGFGGFTGDNVAATTTKLSSPMGVTFDSFGNVFIADRDNHRVRKVDTSGIITTFAGTGAFGYNGDGMNATAAQLYYPFSIALDSFGNVFISETNNRRVRKVFTNGTISTVAGTVNGFFNRDNIDATTAQLNYPYGISIDSFGTLYIVEYNSAKVRKVYTNGTITTVAGTGDHGYNGDGLNAKLAQLAYPMGVTVDMFGNVFIADTSNSRIRKVFTNGTIITVAGTGDHGYNGDNIVATNATLDHPKGVAVDYFGTYILLIATITELEK